MEVYTSAQIDKNIIRKNSTRIDNDYTVVYKLITRNKSEYKYETPFKGLYEIFHTLTNKNATLLTGTVTTKINICNIRTYNNLIVEGQDPLQE